MSLFTNINKFFLLVLNKEDSLQYVILKDIDVHNQVFFDMDLNNLAKLTHT